METFYVVPEAQHNALVAAAYKKRGYSKSEAEAGARFCADASRHGIRTHNAIKALHLDELFGSKAGGCVPGAEVRKLSSRFDAAEALRIGFVNELADDPLAAASALMDTLAANAPLTIAGAKVLLNGLASGSGALDPLQADAVIDGAVSSADYRESVRAFRAKRAPRFEGR